jgi:hypothetical protein
MAATAKKDAGVVEVPGIDILRVNVRIVGMSELVMHAWSEKAKKAMLDKQMGKAAQKRSVKDPQQDYEEAFYRLPDGRPCFPSIAFKAAIVSAARQVDGLPMTFLRGALHIDGEFVPIEGEPRMREDTVRVGQGTADLRYRPGFPEWSATLPIRLNRRALTLEQLLALIDQAGFSVGVGEFRPEKDGAWGMFRVDSVEVEEGQ